MAETIAAPGAQHPPAEAPSHAPAHRAETPVKRQMTTYSFGLDNQEFVIAFESNYPEDFLDLVQQLRETEISAYTLKDTPIYTCIRVTPEAMLDRFA